MLGAIAGDVIGSIYERRNVKTKEFPLFSAGCRFTDDTVLTVAVADCILSDGDFAEAIQSWARRYPSRGYGGTFRRWIWDDARRPYGSFGNGSAMRVSPVAHLARDDGHALELAAASAACTHDHPHGIAGAQAVTLAMRLAMAGHAPEVIRAEVSRRFGYDLSRSVDEIRPGYTFDVTCQGSVPQAITCALEATSFEDAIRNAISIGGDSDTIAAIAGGIAEVRFGVPKEIADRARAHLTPDILAVVDLFEAMTRERRAGTAPPPGGTVH
jgi:ADP-ribosylglycohydrolase